MKLFLTSLCFGLLGLMSVMSLLKSVHGWPHLTPDREHTTHEELLLPLLNRNPDFQRPSHVGVTLSSKLEEFNQLKKLKKWIMEAKNAELSNAVDNLSSSHPNKRACFWKYCV